MQDTEIEKRFLCTYPKPCSWERREKEQYFQSMTAHQNHRGAIKIQTDTLALSLETDWWGVGPWQYFNFPCSFQAFDILRAGGCGGRGVGKQDRPKVRETSQHSLHYSFSARNLNLFNIHIIYIINSKPKGWSLKGTKRKSGLQF